MNRLQFKKLYKIHAKVLQYVFMLSGFSGDKLKYGFTERSKLFSDNVRIKIQLFKPKYILQKNIADSH